MTTGHVIEIQRLESSLRWGLFKLRFLHDGKLMDQQVWGLDKARSIIKQSGFHEKDITWVKVKDKPITIQVETPCSWFWNFAHI